MTAIVPFPVAADAFDDTLGGALGGALLGGLIGGKKGAGRGAAVGGLLGYSHGLAKERERKRQAQEERARYERERLEIERRRQEEERRYREQQAAERAKANQSAGFAASNLVIEIQRSLTTLGYDLDGIDGSLGPSTKKAIVAYQRDKALLETGEPSEALLAHMRKHGG